jgi:predicted ATPase
MRLLAVLGLLSDSHSMASWLIERARQEQHPAALADTLLGSCNQSWIVRDIKALRDRAQSMAELAAEQGLPYFSARACDMLGWVAVTEGRCAEGIVRIELSLKALRQAGNVLHTSQIEAMLSDSHLLAEETDAALAHAEEALQIAAHTGENWLKADLHRRLGGVLLRRGEVPRGEAELCCALDVARSQSARLFELRAARDLARLRRDQGRLADAHSLLAPVYQLFSEGFAFPDLVEAQALLEELDRVCARVTPVRPEASIPLAM